MQKADLDWGNISFLAAAHLLALGGVAWLALVHFSWWTVGLALLWSVFCGLAVTGGYHRLFAHKAYAASAPVRAFYLLFGAAAVQNSALKWSSDHRRHHARTDRDGDPYNISRGFWWAHIGWVFHIDETAEPIGVADLEGSRLVRFQHRHYLAIAIFGGALLPASLGLLWGDWIGALLVAGFLRIVLQWHAAFAVNSVAHCIGKRPFCTRTSARDSFLTALITFGEGYHNFHHRFPRDYRNGVRWWQIDPTKWFVWCLARFGLARDLRRTPATVIAKARDTTRQLLQPRQRRLVRS